MKIGKNPNIKRNYTPEQKAVIRDRLQKRVPEIKRENISQDV